MQSHETFSLQYLKSDMLIVDMLMLLGQMIPLYYLRKQRVYNRNIFTFFMSDSGRKYWFSSLLYQLEERRNVDLLNV